MLVHMSRFSEIITATTNPVVAAMMLILAWIAASDGNIDDAEMDGLRSAASSGESKEYLETVIDVAVQGRLEDLQLACEVLRELELGHRKLMLQMAIAMALEDGKLTSTESYIVRFLADVLGQSPRELNSIFRKLSGHDFPPPSDPSSIEWWAFRESKADARSEASGAESKAGGVGTGQIQQLRDLAVLGLDEAATREDIIDAYKRMVKVHHPDKYAALGPEAVAAAEVTFVRIRSAYERLVVS